MATTYMNKLFPLLSHLEYQDDRTMLLAEIQRKQDAGWTWDDAFEFIRCFEEYNPSLAEDVALSKMAYLERKYKKS